jgi:chromosome segregation ATPase
MESLEDLNERIKILQDQVSVAKAVAISRNEGLSSLRGAVISAKSTLDETRDEYASLIDRANRTETEVRKVCTIISDQA